MEYITTKEAAIKWNISIRQVQRLLSMNRIVGAKKYGNTWMIPRGAKKPGDSNMEKDSFCASAPYHFVGSYHMPKSNPDSLLETMEDPQYKRACQALLQYLRGEYDDAIQCFDEIDDMHPIKLNACFLSSAGAISSGNYQAFKRINDFLKTVETQGPKVNASLAEVLRLFLEIDTYGTTNVPDWIKDENFFHYPPEIKLFLEAHYLKYLQTIKRYEEMRIISKTLLICSYDADTFTEWDLYFRIFYAIACFALNRNTEGKKVLSDALELAIPHGFLGPFAEYFVALSGALEECLAPYPGYYEKLHAKAKYIWNNWILFHNTFTQENLTTILSLKEYQISVQLARGVAYKEIANNMHMPLASTKKIISDIYDKLYIHKKAELQERLMKI